MPKINLPLSKEVSVNSAKNPNNQLLQNMYSIPNQYGEESEYTLRQRGGLDLLIDTGEEVRGLTHINSFYYVVGTTKIRKYDLTGTLVADYAFTTASGEVYNILDNSVGQIAFLSWKYQVDSVYRVLESGTLYNPSLPYNPKTFTDMDGYFIFRRRGTQQFFISALLDGRTFSSLDFASATQKSDNIITVLSCAGILYVFGTRSIEFFQNTGNATFPFEAIKGTANTTLGCGADLTPVAILNEIYFLSRNGLVYKISGYSFTKISTESIDKLFQNISAVNAIGFSFRENGQWFYGITVEDAGFTVCCNLQTLEWHKRTSEGYTYWRPRFVQNAFLEENTKNTICAIGNKVYFINQDNTTDDGDDIERVFTTTVIQGDGKRVIHHAIQPVITTGTAGVDITPIIEMSYSDDGGFTYSTKRSLSLGTNTQYGRKIEFRNLGISRKRIYKFEVSNDVSISIASCKIRLEVEDDE